MHKFLKNIVSNSLRRHCPNQLKGRDVIDIPSQQKLPCFIWLYLYFNAIQKICKLFLEIFTMYEYKPYFYVTI